VESLADLAQLVRRRNTVDREIGTILGRPVHAGHFGEYIAAAIFGIDLHPSAVHKGSDGYFTDGPLAGKSVNIKYYTRGAGLLDMVANVDSTVHPDYYLVLTGPKSAAISSKGTHALWNVCFVYLFSSGELLAEVAKRPVGIGIATSVRKHLWEAAEIYPERRNPALPLRLSPEQFAALSLFSPAAG